MGGESRGWVSGRGGLSQALDWLARCILRELKVNRNETKLWSLSFSARADSRKLVMEQCSPQGSGVGRHFRVRLGTLLSTPCPNLILANQALSRAREGQVKVSLTGDRQQTQGNPESWGQQPLPARTPPTHAESNQKGWLALS